MIYYIGKLKDSNIVKGYEHVNLSVFLDKTKNLKTVQLDTETTGLSPITDNLMCIQIGTRENQFVLEANPENIAAVKPMLEDSTILKILHNAKFDSKFLTEVGIRLDNVYDTMLVECLLTAGLPNRRVSLKYLASKYLRIDVDKSIRDSIMTAGLTDNVIIYSGGDVQPLEDIRDAQLKLVEKYTLQNVVELENKAVLALADIELNGMLLDVSKWTEIASKAISSRNAQEKKLNELAMSNPKLKGSISAQYNAFDEEFDYSINWSSPSQVLSTLNKIGVKVESTDERHLTKFKGTNTLVKELLEHRKQDKLTTSFGMAFLDFVNKKTKRIHPDYWQIVSTGRVSCARPNLLNIPRKGEEGVKIRSCFTPQKGYKYVGGDYSNLELRIITEFSQDPVWLTTFREGRDLHSELAVQVFGIKLEDVKKPFPLKPDIFYRDVQKTIDFGLAFGMSNFKLADTLGITPDEAQDIINKFFEIVPKVKEYLDSSSEFAVKYGYIRTGLPYGRIRFFEGYENKHDFKRKGSIEREARNAPIQGSNSDIVKEAWIRLRDIIHTNNYPVLIINSIYDEIITECREDFAEEWLPIMTKIMEESAQVIIKSIPVKVDCKITDCWSK